MTVDSPTEPVLTRHEQAGGPVLVTAGAAVVEVDGHLFKDLALSLIHISEPTRH